MKTHSYSVLAYDVTDSQTARVRLNVTTQGRNEAIRDFSDSLKGVAVVAHSDRTIDHTNSTQVVDVLIAKRQVAKPATAEAKGRLMEIASNMFMDNTNDSVWSEHDGMLVRHDNIETAEQLEKILASSVPEGRSVNQTFEGRKHYAALASSRHGGSPVESGNYALYIHEGQLYDGFVVALDAGTEQQAIMLARPDDGSKPYPEHRISVSHIVECFDLEQISKEVPGLPQSEKTTVAAAEQSLSGALAYYRKVYSYNKEYFAKFAAMLRRRGSYQ